MFRLVQVIDEDEQTLRLTGSRPGYLRSFFCCKIHLVAARVVGQSCSFQLPGDFQAEQLAAGSNKLAARAAARMTGQIKDPSPELPHSFPSRRCTHRRGTGDGGRGTYKSARTCFSLKMLFFAHGPLDEWSALTKAASVD
jgi:hypothetical protein